MRKNTLPLERIFRFVGGAALAAYALLQLAAPWSIVVAALGLVLALTGLIGFCPMCYVAGRRNKD